MTIKTINELSGNTVKSAKTVLDYATIVDHKREIDFDNTFFIVVTRPGKPSIVSLKSVSYLPEVVKPVVDNDDDIEIDMLALLMG